MKVIVIHRGEDEELAVCIAFLTWQGHSWDVQEDKEKHQRLASGSMHPVVFVQGMPQIGFCALFKYFDEQGLLRI